MADIKNGLSQLVVQDGFMDDNDCFCSVIFQLGVSSLAVFLLIKHPACFGPSARPTSHEEPERIKLNTVGYNIDAITVGKRVL